MTGEFSKWTIEVADISPSVVYPGRVLRVTYAFDGPLDISALVTVTKWIAHTTFGKDFGDSKFTLPEEEFPFIVANGIL